MTEAHGWEWSSDFGMLLTAPGSIAVVFYYTYWAVVAGSVHVTAPVSRQKRVFLSDWLHCSSHKMLCAHTPFMEDNNSLLRCFNSALKASF